MFITHPQTPGRISHVGLLAVAAGSDRTCGTYREKAYSYVMVHFMAPAVRPRATDEQATPARRSCQRRGVLAQAAAREGASTSLPPALRSA